MSVRHSRCVCCSVVIWFASMRLLCVLCSSHVLWCTVAFSANSASTNLKLWSYRQILMPISVLSGSMEATFIMLSGCLIHTPLRAAATWLERALLRIWSACRLNSGATHSPSKMVKAAKIALNFKMITIILVWLKPLVLITANSLLDDNWFSASKPPISVASGIN